MATQVGTLIVNVIGDASRLATTLGAAEKTIERFGSRMFFLGSRMAAGVTLPIVGFMTAVNRAGRDFDKAMTESLAIMDDVSGQMRDRMEQRAFELSRAMKFSSKEIAEGYYDLASAGFTAEETLESIGTTATFAQAGLLSMDKAGEHLAGSVNALGVELTGAQDKAGAMARVADVLTAANNHALGTVEDFASALSTRFAGAMRMNNMQLEDGVALLMAYAQNNIKGRLASQQAWMVLRDLQAATVKAGNAWKHYGINVFDANEKLKPIPDILDEISNATAKMTDKQKSVFFKDLKLQDRSRSALLQLLGKEEDIRHWRKMLEDSAGAAAKVAEKQAESMDIRWKAALHGIENAAIKLYNSFKPILIEVFNWAGKAADRLTEWADKFDKLDDSTKKWIAGVITGLAALGPLFALMGSWTLAVSGMSLAFSGITKTIAAIAKLLPPVSAVLGKSSITSGTLAKIWDNLVVMGTNFIRVLPSVVSEVLPLVLIFDALRPAIKYLLGDSISLSSTWDTLKSVGSRVAEAFSKVAQFVDLNVRVFKVLWAIVQHGYVLLVQLGEVILDIAGDAWKAFSHSVAVVWSDFIKWVSQGGDAILKFLTHIGDVILQIPVVGEILQATFAFGKIIVTEFGAVVVTVFKLAIAMAKSFFETLVDMAARAASKIAQYLPKEVVSLGILIREVGKNSLEGDWGLKTWEKNVRLLEQFGRKIGAVKVEANTGATALRGLAAAGAGVVPVVGGGPPGFTMPGKQGTFYLPPSSPNKSKTIHEILEETLGGSGSFVGEADAKARRLKTILDELLGGGKQKWQETMEVFQANRKEILANEGAVLRLRDAYLSVRDEIEQIPEFEEIFKTDIAVANMEAFSGKFNDFQRDFLELKMGVGSKQDFFKKHGEDIEKLGGMYSKLTPDLMHLINEYRRWQSEMDEFTRATSRYTQSLNALEDLYTSQIELQAQMKDKQEELDLFRMASGDRVLRQLSKNYEQEKLKFWKTVVEKQRLVEMTEPIHRAEAEKTFLAYVANGAKMLEAIKRLDLERLAFSLDVNEAIKQSFKKMTDSQIQDIIRVVLAAQQEADVWNNVSNTFAKLADVIGEGDDGFIRWLATITSAMADAAKAGAALAVAISAAKTAFSGGSASDKISAGYALFDAGVQGAAAIAKATSSANRGRNIAGGALAGAKIGANPALVAMTGGWSIVAGAAIGAIVGAFRGRALRDTMRMVAKEWGTGLSEETTKAINKTKKELGGNRQLAEMAHFGDILKDAGGLSSKNFDTFKDRLRDFFVFASNGMMDSANALQMYADNFGAFADYVDSIGGDLANEFAEHMHVISDLMHRGVFSQTDVMKFLNQTIDRFIQNMEASGRVAGKGWQEILKLNRELDRANPKLMEFLGSVAGKAGEAWAGVIAGITYKFDGLGDKIKEVQDEVKELTDKLAEEGELSSEDAKKLEEAQSKLADLLAQQKVFAADSAEAMNRLGLLVLQTFSSGMDQGLGWVDLMEKLTPALDALSKGFADLGIESDNAAVKELTNIRRMYDSNKQLFQGIDLLTQGMIALSKLGGLTPNTFMLISQQGVEMFRRIQGEVAAMGGTHRQALQPMVPWLAQMRDAAAEYGFELDDVTAEMIRQAEELGLLKPKAASLTDTMATGFDRVAEAIEEMTKKLLAALGVVENIGTATGNITVPQPNFPSNPDPGFPGEHNPTPVSARALIGSSVDYERAEELTFYNNITIETQNVDEKFARTKLIPMLEQLGQRNTQQSRTKLRNAVGVKG